MAYQPVLGQDQVVTGLLTARILLLGLADKGLGIQLLFPRCLLRQGSPFLPLTTLSLSKGFFFFPPPPRGFASARCRFGAGGWADDFVAACAAKRRLVLKLLSETTIGLACGSIDHFAITRTGQGLRLGTRRCTGGVASQ